MKHQFLSPSLTSLSSSNPSGIHELSTTGFDFISHSLLGSPLSRELGSTGQGLQGGALLITGAKVSLSITIILLTAKILRVHLNTYNDFEELMKSANSAAKTCQTYSTVVIFL